MTRPLNDSIYIYGLHDRGGEQIMLDRETPGWVLVTERIGFDRGNHSGGDYTDLSGRGLGVIVRLNAGYAGVGTLPHENRYDDFAQRCANFVRASRGAHIWIVGNEPNHPVEWPGAQWNWDVSPPRPVSEATRGEPITPERYAKCYRQVREKIHSVAGHGDDQVLVAGPAPWNTLTRYPGNETGDWVRYLRDVLTRLTRPDHVDCDGIALHTYTHGIHPDLVRSEEKLTASGFTQYRWHFRAYQDFMAAIPEAMRQLPVYITETDQGDVPWRDENNGWVRTAYEEINDWNKTHAQKIHCLILYRWPQVPGDRWGIAGKTGLIEDIQQAVAYGYRRDVKVKDDLLKRVETLEAQVNQLLPAIQDAQALDAELTRLKEAAGALAETVQSLALTDIAKTLDKLEAEVQRLKDEIPSPPVPVVPPPPMSDLRGKLPTASGQSYPSRAESTVRRVIVHHTVTRVDITPQRLAQAQVDQGRPGITYHFLIAGDGTIYWTQPFESAPAQTFVPAANADGVAVALAGNFTNAPPPVAQLDAAAALIAWLVSRFKLSTGDVYGRRELENVASPGRQWSKGAQYKDALLRKVQEILDSYQDPEVIIARLRKRVQDLQAQVGELKGTLTDQEAEIKALRQKLRECLSGKVSRPEIVDVVDTLEKHPTLPPYVKRTATISTIAIHHTDTPRTFTVQQVTHYHVWGIRKDAQDNIVKAQWPGIAYHYVIAPDGTIYQCQRHETRSYHAGNANNYALGVSLIGRFMERDYDNTPRPLEEQVPTPQQMRSTAHLVAWLTQELKVPIERILGHRELPKAQTSCPGDQWLAGAKWKDNLRKMIEDVLAGREDMTAARMTHYLLLWDHGGDQWAKTDWPNVQNYIAHFRPTVGFSVEDALLARHVTIVGGDAGVTGVDEARLRAAGVEVHRLAGANEAETKAMLDDLVARNTPWPGSPPRPPAAAVITGAVSPTVKAPSMRSMPPAPIPDKWTVPDDWPHPAAVAAAAAAPEVPSRYLRVKVPLFFDDELPGETDHNPAEDPKPHP